VHADREPLRAGQIDDTWLARAIERRPPSSSPVSAAFAPSAIARMSIGAPCGDSFDEWSASA